MVTADYDCDALLRKADSPVEGKLPTTPMTVCCLLMSIIIILLMIIYVRINAFIKHYNEQLHEIYLYVLKNGDFIQRINNNVDYIYSVSDKVKDILEFHVKNTLTHLTFGTDGITEELRYISKCCKENKAKFNYVIKLLRNSSTNKNNKRIKPKTAKLEETK